MQYSPRCIWYFVLAGFQVFSFVILLLKNLPLKFLFTFPIYLNLASFIYFGYMLIIELAASGQKTEGAEKLVNEKNSYFIANQFFKFLFCSIIGINILYIFFESIISDGSFFIRIYLIGLTYLLPIACFLEIYFKERERKPNLIIDLVVIIIILGLKLLCLFFQNPSYLFSFKMILEYILNFACMIIAYIIYDVLVYWKINGSFNGYSLKGLLEKAKENAGKTDDGA